MATSIVGQHQVTTFTTPVNGARPIDANTVRGNDNTLKTAYDAHDNDATIHFQDATAAARPAAGTVGRKWLDNDTYRAYYDDGAAWQEFAYLPTSGGTISGQLTVTSTTTPQLTLKYDSTHSATFSVSSAGALTINATSTVTITPATTITGVATLTAQPILSSLTASQAVFTDGSKGLVSNAITGTGNVVMSASPTLTGTVTAAAVNLSGDFAIATNKFTVASASGNTVVAGTLAVTGALTQTGLGTFNGGLTVASGTLTAGASTHSGLITSTANTAGVAFLRNIVSTTNSVFIDMDNGTGEIVVGVNNSTGANIGSGFAAYEAVVMQGYSKPLGFGTAGTRRGGFSSAGLFDLNAGFTVSSGTITFPLGSGTGVVSVGAADSGGTGFKYLRVPN